MSVTRASLDQSVLANGLLPSLKAHSRITFDEDDTVATDKIAMAIERFQILNGLSLNPTSWTWSPTDAEYDDTLGWRVPVNPVSSFTATGNAINVTAKFALSGVGSLDVTTPQYLSILATDYQSPLVVTLIAGFADVKDLPAGILDVVLRHAATLYEYREMDRIPGIDGTSYANSYVTGYWIPRC